MFIIYRGLPVSLLVSPPFWLVNSGVVLPAVHHRNKNHHTHKTGVELLRDKSLLRLFENCSKHQRGFQKKRVRTHFIQTIKYNWVTMATSDSNLTCAFRLRGCGYSWTNTDSQAPSAEEVVGDPVGQEDRREGLRMTQVWHHNKRTWRWGGGAVTQRLDMHSQAARGVCVYRCRTVSPLFRLRINILLEIKEEEEQEDEAEEEEEEEEEAIDLSVRKEC